MPPTPSIRMMWYRGPNDWPTSRGPVSAPSRRGRRGGPPFGAVGVIGVATVIAFASTSEPAATVSAPSDESGTAIVRAASGASSDPANAIVRASSGALNRVTSSADAGEPVDEVEGTGRPQCGQRSAVREMELLQWTQAAPIGASRGPGS